MGQLAAFLGFAGGAGSAAPVVASGAAFPSSAGATLLGSKAALAAAVPGAGKGAISAASVLKAAAALAPAASALRKGPKGPGRPKEIRVDREAAEAADRERLRRAREGARSTILTGPAGAPGRGLVGRTILSGG